MKADYQILWLAFSALYEDMINLFALELCQVKIKITPTKLESKGSFSICYLKQL